MLDRLLDQVVQLHFQYLEQFLVALAPMAITVVLHGVGMGLSRRSFRALRPKKNARARAHPLIITTTIVAIMLMAHFAEVTAWGAFYFLTGMMDSFKTAMYFSVNAYTTLGASNLSLPGRWQGLDGFEAMTAMLMFGWSTALLATVVQRIHGIDIED